MLEKISGKMHCDIYIFLSLALLLYTCKVIDRDLEKVHKNEAYIDLFIFSKKKKVHFFFSFDFSRPFLLFRGENSNFKLTANSFVVRRRHLHENLLSFYYFFFSP